MRAHMRAEVRKSRNDVLKSKGRMNWFLNSEESQMKHYLLSIVATGMLLLGSSSYASEKVTVDNFVRAELSVTFSI